MSVVRQLSYMTIGELLRYYITIELVKNIFSVFNIGTFSGFHKIDRLGSKPIFYFKATY